MGALWSFCVAVGALFLWLINTYDGDEEQPKEQQGGQQIGRKRNRRKGKPEGDKPYRPGLKYHAMYHGCLLLGTIILRVPGTSLSRFVCVELYICMASYTYRYIDSECLVPRDTPYEQVGCMFHAFQTPWGLGYITSTSKY